MAGGVLFPFLRQKKRDYILKSLLHPFISFIRLGGAEES